jgi:hypothetical protein
MNDEFKNYWVLEFNFKYFNPSEAQWHIHTVEDMECTNSSSFCRRSELDPWLVIGIYKTYEEAHNECARLRGNLEKALNEGV